MDTRGGGPDLVIKYMGNMKNKNKVGRQRKREYGGLALEAYIHSRKPFPATYSIFYSVHYIKLIKRYVW